jgi:hypothetical protein
MRLSFTVVLSLWLCLTAAGARAQDATPLPSTPILLPPFADALTAADERELDAWLDAMHKWQKMDKRWHNEPAHDPFGRVVTRVKQPDPPAWLQARCAPIAPAALATLPPPLGPGCRMLASLTSDPTADAIRTATATARANAEKTVKNTFLTRVHIDGLWTSTSSDSRIYGLVGSHISLVDVGRVQIFGPPGVLVLSVPDGTGSREIRAGYTWGMSIRLGDVRLFASTKNMTLFVTIAKVWMFGGSPVEGLQPGGFDIAGFSLAPRKHKPK